MFDVILAVFEVTLASIDKIDASLAVMLIVFAAIAFVLNVILAVFDAIPNELAVILIVLDAMFVVFVVTAVGSVAIVEELTPPIELIVVGNEPVPLPVTSPVNVINWSPEFTPPTVTSPITVNVVLVLVPPAIVNPVANSVGVNPLIVLFVKLSTPAKVDKVPVKGKVTDVVPVVVKVVLKLPATVKSLDVKKLPPRVIGLPSILTTVGKSAVPLKSPANFNFPFVDASASGVTLFVILANTNSVVATCVVFVPTAAVGAVGVPVKLGEAIVARKAMSAILVVILAVLDAIPNELAVILIVLDAMFVVFVVTAVGSVAIVEELTPPIELIVVGNEPVPLPVTSPVNVINWSPEFTPPTVTSPITVNVVLVLVPPAIVNPVTNSVGVNPLIVLFVKSSAPAKVVSVPVNGNVINVFPVATKVVLKLPEVAK